MALLDFNDPESQLGLIASLLTARKGDNIGLLLQNHATQLERGRSAKQQREMQQMQMEQLKRQQAEQQQKQQLAQRAFAPGVQNLTPNDDQGNPMPTFGGGGLPEYAQGLMGMGDVQGAIGIQQAMQKQQPKYHTVGGALVPEPTNPGMPTKPVYEAPQERWEDAGRDPKTGQQIQRNTKTGQMKAVGMMPSNVNLAIPPLERQEQGEKGKLNIKNFGEIQGLAGSARKENSLLTAMEKNPLDTSRATPITATAAAWLSAAGMGGDRAKQVASNAQQFNAAAMELVLQKQLAQKGPQTESDARRLEQTVASLGNTREANAAIIAFSKAANNKVIQQEKFYNDWWKKHKTMEGADIAWLEGGGGTSIWDDPSLSRFGSKGAGGWSATRIDEGK